MSRCVTTLGQGSLLVVTRAGVAVSGLEVRPAVAPAPTWWSHWRGCGWTAAWFEVRGREWLGQREVLELARWTDEVRWSDRAGRHRRVHRPDLVARGDTPVEVELARKSDARLAATMGLYRGWTAAGRIRGVLYVVGSEPTAERVRGIAAKQGLEVRVELLETIVTEALAAARERAMAGAGK